MATIIFMAKAHGECDISAGRVLQVKRTPKGISETSRKTMGSLLRSAANLTLFHMRADFPAGQMAGKQRGKVFRNAFRIAATEPEAISLHGRHVRINREKLGRRRPVVRFAQIR